MRTFKVYSLSNFQIDSTYYLLTINYSAHAVHYIPRTYLSPAPHPTPIPIPIPHFKDL